MLLEDTVFPPCCGRHVRHASVGHVEIPSEVIKEIKRTYSESAKDPLKRFEYLRNGKATSVMIRATPNAVRWDEINRIQYRFQALNFHSDVLEALIHNSPPLSRRERAATSPQKNKKTSEEANSSRIEVHNNNNTELRQPEVEKTEKRPVAPPTHQRLKCIKRSNSFDTIKLDLDNDEYDSHKRKASVVQIAKDDTSDYNSDEEVFPKSENDSFDAISFNTTICHVENGHIKDNTCVQVTNSYERENLVAEHDDDNNNEDIPDKNLNNRENYNTLNNPDYYDSFSKRENYERAHASAPASTKVSSSSPVHIERCNSDVFTDERDGDELSMKSKEELVLLVKSLQRELQSAKSPKREHAALSGSSSCASTSSQQERHHSLSNRRNSINLEDNNRSSVSELIQTYERRRTNDFDMDRTKYCRSPSRREHTQDDS